MSKRKIIFSPVTRLSGLLSVEVAVEGNRVANAFAGSTMFRGFEWIMRERHATDAVYLTQRICGICSMAHGAVASYLLDAVYDNDISENAQYLRNIMYAADFLQNHIRHFYLFSIPDYVQMPGYPPFHRQNTADLRLNPADNRRLTEHYFEAVTAAQRSHEILALFGGKAPHQHSFLHGGVSTAPAADKVDRALALLANIQEFVKTRMVPDTELLSRAYRDYFKIGVTPARFLSFGLFRFGPKNEAVLWPGGLLIDGQRAPVNLDLIREEVTSSWFVPAPAAPTGLEPDPFKEGAYTWIKAVTYNGHPFQVGPLARMLLTGQYRGGAATMDRIVARTLETVKITELMQEWLSKLVPGPPPLNQKKVPVKSAVTAVTDAMRGALLHKAQLAGEEISSYNIITPTVWNFSPRNRSGRHGPVESALMGTEIPAQNQLFTILGRTIRSFDPCLSCATHVIDLMPGN